MAVVEIHRHRFSVEDLAHMGEAGVPEVWPVDVSGETITVYTAPGKDGYMEERLLRRGEEIVSVAVAELRLPIGEIFGDQP